MNFNEEMVDGRERVTTDEERLLYGGGSGAVCLKTRYGLIERSSRM